MIKLLIVCIDRVFVDKSANYFCSVSEFHRVTRLLPLLAAIVLMPCVLRAQANVTSSSSACACDGAISYTSSLAPPFQVTVQSASGTTISSFNSPLATVELTGLCPSVYVFNLTGNGSSDSAVISVPAAGVNPGNAGTAEICSNAGLTPLSSFVSGFQAGGQWTNPAGGNDNGNYNPQGEDPGLYVYTITSGGCAVSTGVLVSELQNSNAGLSTTYLICENYAPFFMTSVMTGNPNPGGTWAFAGGAGIDGWFYPATMNTGLFTYTVPGVPGCDPVVSTLFVIENLIPNPGVNTSILVCAGAPPFSLYAQLQGNPDPGGTWYNQSNQVIGDLFNPAVQPAGVYRYSVDGQIPCTDQDAFLTIGYTTTNPSGTSASLALCQNAAPVNLFNQLGGSPVAGGTWTAPQGQTFGGTFNPTTGTPGNYVYYYPNVGCSPADAVVTVSVQSLPQAGPDQSVPLCQTSPSVNLNTLLAPGTTSGGAWTTGGQPAANTFQPSTPGNFNFTYTVTGTPCPADQSVLQIQVASAPPTLTNYSGTLCATANPVVLSTLFPAYPGLTFTDNGGNAIIQYSPSQQGVLPVTATLPSGNVCPPSTATVNFTIEQPAFINTAMYYPVCELDEFLDLTANGFNADYTSGVWSMNGTQVPAVVPLDFTGQRTYLFTSDPGISCASSVLTVNVETTPAASAGPDAEETVCITAPAFDFAPLLPGAAITPGIWYLGNTALTSTLFDPATGNSATFRFVTQEIGSCPADEAELTIEADPGIVLDLGADLTACSGDPAAGMGVITTPGYSYQWFGSGYTGNGQSSQVSVPFLNTTDSPLTLSFELTATNGVCASSDEIGVTIYPLPDLSVTGDEPACEGEEVALTALSSGIVSWSGNEVFANPAQQVQSFIATESVIYQVDAVSAFGCESSVSGILEVFPAPQPVVNALPGEGCQPFTYQLSLEDSSAYIASTEWTVNGNYSGTGVSRQWVFTEPGWYDFTLTVTSPGGCPLTLEWDSLVHVLVQAEAGILSSPEELNLQTPEVTLDFTGNQADSIWWTLDGVLFSESFSGVLSLPDGVPGEYVLCQRVASMDGCPDSLCKLLVVENTPLFFAPNAFTPDQDGLNEVFLPVYYGYVDNSWLMRIYDRWGILIFESRDPSEGWMGNINGGNHFAPNDVYQWQVELKDVSRPDYVRFTGHVTLIR